MEEDTPERELERQDMGKSIQRLLMMMRTHMLIESFPSRLQYSKMLRS